MWQTKPLVLVVGRAIVLLLAIIFFGGESDAAPPCLYEVELDQQCLRSPHCYLRHLNSDIDFAREQVEYVEGLCSLADSVMGAHFDCGTDMPVLSFLLRERDRILDGGKPPPHFRVCLDLPVPPDVMACTARGVCD